METGLLSPCCERSSQVFGVSHFSAQSRISAEASCSSSNFQLSGSFFQRTGNTARLAGQRLNRRVNAPPVLNVRSKEFNRFNPPNQKKPSDKMKMPDSGGGGTNRLPGHGMHFGSQQISPPGLGQFRPPPSSYVPELEETEEERESNQSRRAALFERLRDGMGSWQERAADVKEVQQLGVTSEELYSVTFVAVVKQTAMVVAAQVYESVVQAGASAETLEWFDEETIEILYALRTLSAGQRKTAAEYVASNSLNTEEAQELARAIKDHERRPQGREGFTTAAGDCLAYLCYRGASESTDAEVRSTFVERGLRVAATDSARERFKNVGQKYR